MDCLRNFIAKFCGNDLKRYNRTIGTVFKTIVKQTHNFVFLAKVLYGKAAFPDPLPSAIQGSCA